MDDNDEDNPMNQSTLEFEHDSDNKFSLKSISVQIFLDQPKSGSYPLVKEFTLKFSHTKLLFYLTKEQVLKCILSSISIENSSIQTSKRGEISLSALRISEILSDMEAPTYRQTFTSVTGSLC